MKEKYIAAAGPKGVNNLKAEAHTPKNFGMNFFKRDKKGRWTHRQ